MHRKRLDDTEIPSNSGIRIINHTVAMSATSLTIMMTPHDDGAWQTTENCPDATVPDARVSITRHNEGAWQTTLCCTNATALNVKVKLSVSTNAHDADEWRPTERSTE